MIDIESCSTEVLKDRLAVEMTNLTGGHLTAVRGADVARETTRVAFELRYRSALNEQEFEEVIDVCNRQLSKQPSVATTPR